MQELLNDLGIKVGDKFTILGSCEDTDLMDWYEEQNSEILTINEIDYESGIVWTDECPYGIWVQEISLIK